MADDLLDGLDDLFDDDDISNLLSSTDNSTTGATPTSQNTQTSQQIPLPRPSSNVLNHQPINAPTVITSNIRTSSTTIPMPSMPQQQQQQPFNNAFNNRSSQPFINFQGMNPSHNIINPNQMHSVNKPPLTQQDYLNLMRNPNQVQNSYPSTPLSSSNNNNNNFMRMNTLPLNLPSINNNNSNSATNNPYLMQVANLNKQQQLVKGFMTSQQPQGKYSASATQAPPKPSIPLHSVINQMGGNPKLGFSTIINPPSSSSSNQKLAHSFLNSLQNLNTPTGGVIPPSFFTSAPSPPIQITLPTNTKGLLEISAGTKLGKKWPKLLSEIPKVEITVVNNRIWQSLVLSPNSNTENNSIRCYVPDFGSEFDDFDDDDLDDEEDDMLLDEEDFNNLDEESFDLNKFNSKAKKTQGMKRTRSGERPRQKGNACLYLFSPNREAFGYISSQEYNNCFVPLSKHKIIMVTVSPLPNTDNSGRFFVSLKIYLVKKALVTDKNILESNNDSSETNNNLLAAVDGLVDEQIRIYNIRKNFLKKLFEILDRNNCSTSVSSSDLSDYDSSKVRKTSESDINASRVKQEEEDDLDALDDDDLDEYIIQKAPASSSSASSSNLDAQGTDKSLEKQLEELYDEIEKTIVDDENAENDFSDEDESSHHEIEIPDDTLLTADLRSYQKTAVKWMLKRERIGEDKVKSTPKLHSLYQERKFPDGTAFYFNPLNGIITLTFVPAPPEPKGGILADEMGLGKTVEVIGLIASNRMKGKKNTQKVADKYLSPATLVVTPLTIVDQWKQEIEKHTNNQLSVYVYQGSRRIRDAPTLLKYDVIITTYNTLSFEFSQTYTPAKERSNAKKKQTKDTSMQQPSPIYKMKFFRVVLDEAHNIKNRKSLQARATAAVDAERRWAVTGTPIQNHIDDLFSLFHFLKVNPHGDWRWWSRFIGKPFEKKEKKSVEALQSVIKKLVIRRTKNKKINGKRIVMLPPKRVETVTIQFTEAESNFYKSLYEYSKGKFNEFVRSGTVLKNYANILEMLLHLRQVCNHPALIITSFQKKSEKSTMNGFLESFEQKNAFEVYDSILPMLPQVLKLNKEKNKSKQNLEDAMISSQLKAINVTKYMRTNWRSSSKIGALIEKLRVLELGTKSVVFSQWTSMLDLVEVALEKSNIRFVRLDGKMQRKDRDDAVQKFKFDPHIQVCLISLKVGGTGLNLVWATHVFLLDPWWNPAIEEQAIDRVHRIGQDKPVTVFRFVVKDSVEERILSLQKSKTKIANEALNLGGSDDEEEENYTTYTTSFLGGSFGGGALKSKAYDSDEEYEDDEEDEFNEVTVDDLEDEESGSGGGMFGHTKKDAQKIRIKDLSTIFV